MRVDKPFLILVIILACVGFFIFTSASLGLIARAGTAEYSAALMGQLIGLIAGCVACVITTHVPFRIWHRYSFYIFLGSIVLTLLVFIPGINFSSGGAQRWLALGPLSFQPAEILKIGFVLYAAAWMTAVKDRIRTIQFGILPLIALYALIGLILVFQPDLDTLLVIIITGIAMFIAAGGKWKHVFGLSGVGIGTLLVASLFFDYVRERIMTFVNPALDPLNASYQIQQSLIAIGSGGIFGRGFGQSVQKFGFLPEPVGDSIFAVFAEEWGFVGALVLIALFLALGLRGLRIATRAPNTFAMLAATGLVLLVVIQSFINMASMLNIFPLAGMPLLFVSQGGSALLATLAAMGIVLNISKHTRVV